MPELLLSSGDHGKAPAWFPAAGRFNSRIQCQAGWLAHGVMSVIHRTPMPASRVSACPFRNALRGRGKQCHESAACQQLTVSSADGLNRGPRPWSVSSARGVRGALRWSATWVSNFIAEHRSIVVGDSRRICWRAGFVAEHCSRFAGRAALALLYPCDEVSRFR